MYRSGFVTGWLLVRGRFTLKDSSWVGWLGVVWGMGWWLWGGLAEIVGQIRSDDSAERVDRIRDGLPGRDGISGAGGPLATALDIGRASTTCSDYCVPLALSSQGASVRIERLGGVDRCAGDLLRGSVLPGELVPQVHRADCTSPVTG